MSTIPRLVISAPSSGHGKTAVSVGLLAALSARGFRAAGFKIGPDHVDAAYLGLAAGRPGRNLDPRMVGAKRMGPLFAYGAGSLDVAVVEGTMGLFDGLAGRTDSESTAQISGLLRAPVVLVVDVGAMGQSVAALVHGFRAYDELLWLGGVILNRVASSRHEQLLREALDDIGVPVLGALRRHALTDIGDAGVPLPSRQHGVAPVVHHNLDAIRAVRRLGEVIAGAVDIDRTMALARSAPRLTADPWSAEAEVAGAQTAQLAVSRIGRRPVVGVAFAYPETAELLRAAGAEVVPFDPLRDEVLPEGVDGLVVGSALPESYAEELTFNGRLRAAVAAHAAAGKPIAAEGTGLVWLCRDFNGRPMCGVVDASARETDLVVLGYREATARTSSVLVPVGAQVVGHKMHRTTVNPRAGLQAAWTWAGGPAEGFVHRGVHASYLGLHWAGTPEIATRFVGAAGAVASPAPGPWTTPSTQPYGRPAAQPVGTPATLQFPAAAQPAATTVPVAAALAPSPVTGPGAGPAGGSGWAPPSMGLGGPTYSSGPGAVAPVSAGGPAGSVLDGGSAAPVSGGGSVTSGAAGGSGAPVSGSGPAAPGSGSGPAAPGSGSGSGGGPEALASVGAGPLWADGPDADGAGVDADGVAVVATSPFGPTSRTGAALASAANQARPGEAGAAESEAGAAESKAGAAESKAGAAKSEAGAAAAESVAGAAESEAGAGTVEGRAGTAVSQAGTTERQAGAGVAEGAERAGEAEDADSAGTVVAAGADPANATAGASVGVPSAPISPAGAGGLTSSDGVPTPSENSPSSAGQPVGASAAHPVSTPPVTAGADHPRSVTPETSAAMPVSSAPMPTVIAPISVAPAGMTVMSAASSDLMGHPDELPTVYLPLPTQPAGPAGQTPVSAPPDSGPGPSAGEGESVPSDEAAEKADKPAGGSSEAA